jgi:cell division protein ZapA
MSDEIIPVTVRILEKEYKISCPAGEHESLISSAQHVHKSMQKIRDSGKVLGAERIAVMAAINIAHELFGASKEQTANSDVTAQLDSLQQSVDAILKTASSSS